MFRQRIVGVLAAVMLMTGCASSYGTSHTRADISDRYQEDEQGFAGTRMNYTMTRRNVITEIQGNPFHMDQDVFNLVTAQVLTAQQPGPRMYYQPKIDFRDLPAQAPRQQYRFVVVFNPQSTVTGAELCAGAQVPTMETRDGRLALRTAFCRNNEYLTGAVTEMGDVGSVRDRTFSRALSNNRPVAKVCFG